MKDNYKIEIYGRIEELLKSDRKTIVVTIDGMCASGKSTLAKEISEHFKCNLFHMDDFFLQIHQRTEERLLEVGGNVDYERFKEEVKNRILNEEDVEYRKFNCRIGKIEKTFAVPFKRLNIIEGVYSNHPYFDYEADLKIYMEISSFEQRERIKKRNGEKMLNTFIEEWIPKENDYFEKFNIKNNCDIILKAEII